MISGASSGSVYSAWRPLEAEALADFTFFLVMTVPHRNNVTVRTAFARKLMEIANSIEPVQDGRIRIELINWPFLHELRGSPAEYKAGLDFAIDADGFRSTRAEPM